MLMRILFPILLVLGLGLGAGCVVREPAYSATYVAYDTGYPVYWADGYYWSYYGGGWYWWSHDRWVVSHVHPRSPVVVTSNHGGHGGYHATPSTGGMYVRDHRAAKRYQPTRVRAPATRSAPVRSAPARVQHRNHRR